MPSKTAVTWPVWGLVSIFGRQLQVHALFVGDEPEAEQVPGSGVRW